MRISTPILACAIAATAAACSSGVNPAVIRNWADANASNYKALIDARTTNADSRRNAYRAVASLVCDADVTEDKVDSAARRCNHATSDSDADQFCTEFFANLPAPMLPPAPPCAQPAPIPATPP